MSIHNADTELVPIHPTYDFEFVESQQELIDRVDRLEAELKRLHAQLLRRQPACQVNYSPTQPKKYNNWVELVLHEWIPG